jgi:cytochrome c oxidase cbb3-type subunit 1
VLGGALYLFGMLVMLWNVIMTALKGRVEQVPIPAVLAAYA